MGNSVVLTFVGDETKLQKAAKNSVAVLDDVAKSADNLDKAFGKSSDGIDQKTGRIGTMMKKFGSNIVETVQNASAKLPGILGSAVSSLPPQGQAIALVLVGGLAAALGPMLGAAIGAAILVALGGGALILGIKAATEDPRVKKAFGGLSEKAKQSFQDFGKPFVEPLIRAAETFGKILDFMKPFNEKIGAAIAPVIDKLAPAVQKFVEEIMPGLTKSIEESTPLFEVIAKHAPKIGEMLGEFFEKLGEDGEGSAEVLDDILELVGHVLKFVLDWIVAMKNLYLTMKVGWRNAKEWAKNFWDWLKELPGKIKDVFSSIGKSISSSFKSAFNSVARHWNSTVGALSWTVPDWIPGLGGKTVNVPNMPVMHKGGIVPGAPGTEVPILAMAGETVTPAGKTPVTRIELNSSGSQVDDFLIEMISRAVRSRGGNVQLVLGGRNA